MRLLLLLSLLLLLLLLLLPREDVNQDWAVGERNVVTAVARMDEEREIDVEAVEVEEGGGSEERDSNQAKLSTAGPMWL